jgi:hypothetical protein
MLRMSFDDGAIISKYASESLTGWMACANWTGVGALGDDDIGLE